MNGQPCTLCGEQPRWTDDPHKQPSGWSFCHDCYNDMTAGFRRRHDADLRLERRWAA